jgi:hypothetical protein
MPLQQGVSPAGKHESTVGWCTLSATRVQRVYACCLGALQQTQYWKVHQGRSKAFANTLAAVRQRDGRSVKPSLKLGDTAVCHVPYMSACTAGTHTRAP